MTVLVLGLGISGKAAVSFLLQKNIPVIGVDRTVQTLVGGTFVQDQGDKTLIPWNEIQYCIVSPGFPPTHPLLLRAKNKGIEILGEIEFACRHLKNKMVGITGSNGKTTTTLLVTHVLNSCGIAARALGNVGVGLSTYLLNPKEDEVLIVELSSFQLETLRTPCLALALILNITPNHLDRHASMDEYATAKLSIGNCLNQKGTFFVSKQVLQHYHPKATLFEPLLLEEPLQNLQAAFAICHHFGVSKEAFYRAYQTFTRPPHRMEKIDAIPGICVYNDSKSSNVDSVLYAVKQLESPLIIIVGGVDKGASYQPWVKAFFGKVKQIVAYGAAREKIAKEIGVELPLTTIELFADAVDYALAKAEIGDTVVLSPGCSSYDQFRNFEHRGDVFKELIQRRYGTKENYSHCSIH